MCNGPGALLLRPASWVHFLYFYFWDCLGASPLDVLFRPSDFTLGSLPPFYRSFLSAWRAVDGGGGGVSVSRGSFAIGCSSGLSISPVSTISTKSVYSFLLSENLSTPHCVVKFAPIFGILYWSCTWPELFLFDVDRPDIDLAWKIAHGVLYTADRLASFGYSPQLSCFCNSAPESIFLSLFFLCFNLLCFVGLCLLLLLLSVIFVSVLVLKTFLASQKCSSTS